MAEVLASASMTASTLAFGGWSDVSFLAAGTAPDSINPGIIVYRTDAAYVDGVLPLATRIPSPAAVCRVAWSRPTEPDLPGYSSPFPKGLIAGGLKSGVVAVWDPHEALFEPTDLSTINYYFRPGRLEKVHGTTPNLVAGGHDHENRATAVSDPHSNDSLIQQSETKGGRWFSPFRVFDDHFSPDGPPQPPSLDSSSADLTLPASSSNSMVALMSCHSDGPVFGLSFSPTTPHFLASGGAKGTVFVWNLINPSAKCIPHFQYNEDGNVKILDLSWNALNPDLIASASNVGVKILDISAKPSVIEKKISSMETCSAVEWSPTDKDMMVVASGNYCKVWDVRKVDKPLHQFSDTNSIVDISWCPFEKETVLACTEEKLLFLNVKKGKVVHEVKAPGKCLAIRWSQHRANHFALATEGGEPATEGGEPLYGKVEMYRGVCNKVD